MSQLINLVYRSRNFLLFIVLELLSFWLLVKNNNYWGVSYFNSTNSFVANTLQWQRGLTEYFHLKTVNQSLANENRRLQQELVRVQQKSPNVQGLYHPDSLFASRFDFTVAKVIKSSANQLNNYLTLDKGTRDGIEPGMGVISPQGVVGQVISCSEHFSRVVSILHTKSVVSAEVLGAKLRRDGIQALGIGKWDGANPTLIKLTNIDRFKPVSKGDSVVTSEQNAVFPARIPVGRISSIQVGRDNSFFDIDVKLSTDFTSITYVYIVKNKLLKEQEALEKAEGSQITPD